MQPSAGKTTESFGALTIEKQYELQAIAVAKAAEAEVQSAYIMALKRPRSEENARVAILRVCKNPIFAKKAKYRKPVGGQTIVGPSIRMAEELKRLFGNMLTQQMTIYEDESKRIIRIVDKDLETNVGYSKEITIDKTVERKNAAGREVLSERLNTKRERVFIVRATEDELLNKENALASKAIRNNILRLIPEHILDEALAVVDATLRTGAQVDPRAARLHLIDGFAEVGVKPSDLEEYLKHPLEQLNDREIVELGDMLNALKDGQAKWADFLEAPTKTEPEHGSLDSFKAGKQETHTDVTEPLELKQPDPMGASVESQLIEAHVNYLSKSTAGSLKLAEVLKTFKVRSVDGVAPMHRPNLLDALKLAQAQLPAK